MLLKLYGVAATLLMIAIAFALFGFGVLSDDSPTAAKVCAGFFLVTAGGAFGWAWLNRTRRFDGPAPRRTVGRPERKPM